MSTSGVLTWEVTVPRSAPDDCRILYSYMGSKIFYSPVKFSRSTFSMIAPKSTSDEGTEMG